MNNKKLKIAAAAALVMAASAGYIAYENLFIGVSEYSLPLSASGYEGLKICHLSDIHVKTNPRDYSRLIRLCAEGEPDLIFITGDLFDSRASDFTAAATLCETLCDIAPVYFVTGNHEEKLPADLYERAISSLTAAGVKVLGDKAEKFYYNERPVNIIGVYDRESPDYGLINALCEDGALNLLLSHRPQFAEGYAEAGADIAFCGHAHGGQARLPFVGGIIAPDQFFFPELYEGVHRFGERFTVISRGLGNSIIPVRVNNRPEIVFATVESEVEA